MIIKIRFSTLCEEQQIERSRQQFIENQELIRDKNNDENEDDQNNKKPKQREEWMLKPGVQEINKSNALTNRGFTGASNAVLSDDDSETEKEKRRQMKILEENDPEMIALREQQEALQKEIDDYNKKHGRTTSLLDQHKAKMAKKETNETNSIKSTA